MTNSKRYIFVLSGVNINKVDQKYGITHLASIVPEDTPNHIPENTTKIVDLDIIKKVPDVVSFLDESKRLRRCTISMIDFSNRKNLTSITGEKIGYKCYWDRNDIPENVQPVGCPIRYISPKATKTYHSEISKEKYTIRENMTPTRAEVLNDRKDERITIEPNNYYETDGIFCSFNCCMAYIQSVENKSNPLYRSSESLLLKMYNDMHPGNQLIDILPAPHWRTLKAFGGHLTIEQFRESFNKVSYVDHGIFCVSIGRLFEDQIKF